MRMLVLTVFYLAAYTLPSSGQDRIDLPQAIELALKQNKPLAKAVLQTCLLYTSDAADE